MTLLHILESDTTISVLVIDGALRLFRRSILKLPPSSRKSCQSPLIALECQLGDKTAISIARLLERNSTLTDVNISRAPHSYALVSSVSIGNRIGDQGIAAIAAALSTNKTCTDLHMSRADASCFYRVRANAAQAIESATREPRHWRRRWHKMPRFTTCI